MSAVSQDIAGPRTQAERTAESDARMLDTAVRLIVERGADGMTLKDVGELAGYSRGLAGHRFGSKTGLFSTLVRSVGEDWLEELGSAVDGKSGLAAILAATDTHFRFVSERDKRIRAFYILWFHSIGPDPDLKQVIAHIHERRQRDVEGWIRGGIAHGSIADGINVSGIAEHFCAAIIGIVYQWLASPADVESIRQLHEGLKQQMVMALNHSEESLS